MPVSGCTSVGMPRPSSETVQQFPPPPPSSEPESCSTTLISAACPASASSTELSSTSWTRWCSPSGPVEPMYIPGRFRTGSRPVRTVI
ncbi:hypothetical protein ACHAWF_011605 [Thalassiosira exigua]